MQIFKSAEEAAEHVNATIISGDRFELAISDEPASPTRWGRGWRSSSMAFSGRGTFPTALSSATDIVSTRMYHMD